MKKTEAKKKPQTNCSFAVKKHMPVYPDFCKVQAALWQKMLGEGDIRKPSMERTLEWMVNLAKEELKIK
tara:strand:+ start:407 stop:613 length:207 start_codon:yes stop_codon:yes gene_type:complete